MCDVINGRPLKASKITHKIFSEIPTLNETFYVFGDVVNGVAFDAGRLWRFIVTSHVQSYTPENDQKSCRVSLVWKKVRQCGMFKLISLTRNPLRSIPAGFSTKTKIPGIREERPSKAFRKCRRLFQRSAFWRRLATEPSCVCHIEDLLRGWQKFIQMFFSQTL